MTKNPYDTVFWNDIENDAELKTCSLAAKGLWLFNLLPIAARSPQRGVIIIGNWPCRHDGDLPTVLANVAGGSPDVIAVLVTELVNSGAASIDCHGRIFNRRMVRARELTETRSKAGKAGAKAKWQKSGKYHGKEDGKTETEEHPLSGENTTTIPGDGASDRCEGDGKSMPSSFFGASYEKKILDTSRVESFTAPAGAGADERGEPDIGSDAGSQKARAEARGMRLPDGWQPSSGAEQFARDLGLKPESVTPEFVDHWRAVPGVKGRKLDWDATYRNRCRQIIEWGKSNGAKRGHRITNGAADEDPILAGVSESLARRHLLPRG